MNQPHHPRLLIALLSLLVTATFFVATLRTFTNAHAIASITATPATITPSSPADELELEPASSTQTITGTDGAGGEAGLIPTPTQVRDPRDGDTTGIIAMVVLLVTVLLVAMVAGERSAWMKEKKKK